MRGRGDDWGVRMIASSLMAEPAEGRPRVMTSLASAQSAWSKSMLSPPSTANVNCFTPARSTFTATGESPPCSSWLSQRTWFVSPSTLNTALPLPRPTSSSMPTMAEKLTARLPTSRMNWLAAWVPSPLVNVCPPMESVCPSTDWFACGSPQPCSTWLMSSALRDQVRLVWACAVPASMAKAASDTNHGQGWAERLRFKIMRGRIVARRISRKLHLCAGKRAYCSVRYPQRIVA